MPRNFPIGGVLKAWITAGAALVLALPAGYALGHHGRLKSYAAQRIPLVMVNASMAGRVETLVIGDSIAESVWLDGACGKTYNAGVGGSRVYQVEEVARRLIPVMHPRRIVVQAGANHFLAAVPEPKQFLEQYRHLLAVLPRNVDLILYGVPNNPEATESIRAYAAHIGARFVPPVTGALTRDGVHPTKEGAIEWRRRLVGVCRT